MSIGDSLICYSSFSVFTIGKSYIISNVYNRGGKFGECIEIKDDDGSDKYFSINEVEGKSYATWFSNIRDIRNKKLEFINKL
jgi:hypothetical protein